MPELAEVYYYSQQWSPGLGKTVLHMDLHAKKRIFRGCDVAALEEGLPGTKLRKILTHGKQMLFEFSGGHWLWLHLGMTGDLTAPKEPYEAAKHDHLVLHLRDRALVFKDPRQFGAVRYYHEKTVPEFWAALPPQPQDKAFTLTALQGFLERHPRTPLKALLLDQTIFPGIGNWMADEVMWQTKLAPHRLATSLTLAETRAFHKNVHKVSKVAMETVGKDWTDPPKTWLFSHRWQKGHACPRCHGALKREELRGRTACWCPHCQH